MPSSIEVKKEIEVKHLEANSNEKYLYSKVTELEKRNQKLEKKVKKLKRKKRELKQEVAKLRGKIQSQGSEGDEELSGQDEDQGVSQMIHCFILNFHSLHWDNISRFWINSIAAVLNVAETLIQPLGFSKQALFQR